MGKAVSNAAVQLSGRIDQFVYRRTRDGLVVARRPQPNLRKRRGRKNSAAQAAQRERFVLANEYAKRVLADPLARRAYERLGRERNRRFDRIAASDFLTPPEIEHIELSGYRGQPGGVIRVLAFDDVEVVAVQVQIRTAAGALLEEGEAKSEHGVWNYTATAASRPGAALVVNVTAIDRPGNRTTQERTLAAAAATTS